MALPRAVLIGGGVATAGALAFGAWSLWPTKERRVERQLSDPTNEQFSEAFRICRAQQTVGDVQRCVASQLYPGASFPPPPWAPSWQEEAWEMIGQRVRGELGLTPVGTVIQAVTPAATMDLAAIQAVPGTPRHVKPAMPVATRVLLSASVLGAAAAGATILYRHVRG